jgi:uncharacterized protein (TIGR02996 family)
MSQANAFLAAILDEPDLLAHRLVFADWLEDQPDEPSRQRGEFIHAQIERESLPPTHPRARALLRREAEILEQHGRIWADPIVRKARGWTWHNGFIEQVSIDPDELLRHGAELFAAAPLRRVHLHNPEALQRVLRRGRTACKTFADLLCRVKALDFRQGDLGEAVASAFLRLPRLPGLEGLYLTRARSVAGLPLLAGAGLLDAVKTLDLSGSSAREPLETLLPSRHIQHLETLRLTDAMRGDLGVQILTGQPPFPRLRHLALGHDNIGVDGLRELTTSTVALGLETLELSFNPLGPEGAAVLAGADVLPRLTSLNLSRTALGDDGVRLLAEAPLLGRLLDLDLSLNRIGPAGALALASTKQPLRLRALDLIYNALDIAERRRLLERFGAEVCALDR